MYPELLRKGDRGKHHDPNSRPANYGEQRVAEGVAGVELLEAFERGDIYIGEEGKRR